VTALTIFSIPKAFDGHTDIIQQNALQSWAALPDTEILLFGNDNGVDRAAWKYNARHITNGIRTSKYGTPCLKDVFEVAQKEAKGDHLCYVNADIILYKQIVGVISSVPLPLFLATGQRLDIDVETPTDAHSMAFINRLVMEGKTQDFPGMDFFLFKKGMYPDFLPFIVGRRGWDNWLMYHTRSRGIPVVDCSDYFMVVHQNHDYKHIPQSCGNRWEKCPESDYNLSLIKNRIIYLWELDDATHDFKGNWGLREKPKTIRSYTQGLILKTPEKYHWIIEPVYRAGHIAKWVFLKATRPIRK
jgi:hypothetical protein